MSIENMEALQGDMRSLRRAVLAGEVGVAEADVAARAGFVEVKVEEVNLRHRIARASGDLALPARQDRRIDAAA